MANPKFKPDEPKDTPFSDSEDVAAQIDPFSFDVEGDDVAAIPSDDELLTGKTGAHFAPATEQSAPPAPPPVDTAAMAAAFPGVDPNLIAAISIATAQAMTMILPQMLAGLGLGPKKQVPLASTTFVDINGNLVNEPDLPPGSALYVRSPEGGRLDSSPPRKKAWTLADWERGEMVELKNRDPRWTEVIINGRKFRTPIGKKVTVPKVVEHVLDECADEALAFDAGYTPHAPDSEYPQLPRLEAKGGFSEEETYLSVMTAGGEVPPEILPKIRHRSAIPADMGSFTPRS